jgi:hypothetical protein
VYLDPGDRYKNATGFPSGLGGKTSQIFSNSQGVIEGIFFVPNTNSIKFLTGTRQFVLIDISTLDRTTALSYAQTEFVSTGTMQTYQESLKHTRKYVVDTTIVTTTEPSYDSRDDGDRDNGPANFYSANGTWVGSGYVGYPSTTSYGKTWTDSFKEADKSGNVKGGGRWW